MWALGRSRFHEQYKSKWEKHTEKQPFKYLKIGMVGVQHLQDLIDLDREGWAQHTKWQKGIGKPLNPEAQAVARKSHSDPTQHPSRGCASEWVAGQCLLLPCRFLLVPDQRRHDHHSTWFSRTPGLRDSPAPTGKEGVWSCGRKGGCMGYTEE